MPLDARDKIALEGLEARFTHHAPAGDQGQRYEKLRTHALAFAKLIVQTCPSSPERSTSLTNLDSCLMFAIASIARNSQQPADGGEKDG